MAWIAPRPKKMSLDRRIQQIQELLEERSELSVEEIARELGVSFTWARRLMRIAEAIIPNAFYDDYSGVLKKIKERRS